METLPQNEHKKIIVTGAPWVRLVEPTEYRKHEFRGINTVLVLGPTGAGKSSFIEAFASNTSLGISSNQLEGFTQSISTYQLINVTHAEDPIYLVDVPGFSDTKISEMKILSMLKDWMQQSDLVYFERIIYFMPINSPRLPGSQREVLRTFQALTGVGAATGITIVTTMWDQLWSEKAKQRGEHNFDQLRDDDYVGKQAEMLKFYNTRESALLILDNAFQRTSGPHFKLQPFIRSGVPLRETTFGGNIYHRLQTRIWNVHIELANIQFDLFAAPEEGEEQLIEVLVSREAEAQKLLAMLKQELLEFGEPPYPEPFIEKLQLPNPPDALTGLHGGETQDIAPATASSQREDALLPAITTSPIDGHSELASGLSLPHPHPESVVTTTSSSNEPASSHTQRINPAIASLRVEESSLHVISTSPKDVSSISQKDAALAFVPREAPSPHSPATIAQLDPSRMLILKGLLRRLIQAAKRRGKTWFWKTKD